jgi:hypothetical protein
VPATVTHRLIGGGNGIEDEIINPAPISQTHGLFGIIGARIVGTATAATINARHFASNLAGKIGGIKCGNPASTRLTRQKA